MYIYILCIYVCIYTCMLTYILLYLSLFCRHYVLCTLDFANAPQAKGQWLHKYKEM